jgi:orotidine-5'-phosphate decarboxylase
MTFAERFLAARDVYGPFCLGIDPTPELLRSWALPDNPAGLSRFCEIVVSAASGVIGIVKPQLAYFERFGAEGIATLIATTAHFRSEGVLVLLDAKRGDIGSTATAYAHAFLGPDSAFKADAMTVHPYLGFEALDPLCRHAVAVDTGVFVVVRSSNPEGAYIQSARLDDGRTVAECLADSITEFNRAYCGDNVGAVGAVIGATVPDGNVIVSRLPRSLILAPGVGHQGASLDEVRRRLRAGGERVMPTAARSILEEGPDIQKLRESLIGTREAAVLVGA